MKFDYLREEFQKQGFKVTRITFLEDGYEIRLKMAEADEDNFHDTHESLRQNLKKLDLIDYKGFIAVETTTCNDLCTLLLAPKSMEEMTEFVWKYVEKYGKKDQRLVDILADAFCVLEKVVECIPDEYGEEKDEAKRNYDSFSGMVF